MNLQGHSIIGNASAAGTGKAAHATNPATGESLSPDYLEVSEAQANEAVAKAAAAFPIYRKSSSADRATFLRTIAEQIEARGDELAERGPLETGLPKGRIRMETGRTCGQLRLFASVAEDGSWVDARIDHADPDRQPIPKPDVRSMLQGLGPVAVFCASNFPLAFSVAGGDTASALAAGCPVIVKAHHSHPGTAEIVGQAVQAAAQKCEALIPSSSSLERWQSAARPLRKASVGPSRLASGSSAPVPASSWPQTMMIQLNLSRL